MSVLAVASMKYFPWVFHMQGYEHMYPIDGNSGIQPGGAGGNEWVLMSCALDPVVWVRGQEESRQT